MQTETYYIPTSQVETFIKKFETIQRKAEKLGGLVGYKLGGTEERELSFVDPVTDQRIIDSYLVREVEVWGESPVIEGWEVIAVVDHTPALAGSPFNIVHNLGSGDAAERFKTLDNDCDHCGWNRARKTTVVIRHTETREQKHVGLGCLGDFTGSHDPHHAARLCTYLTEALTKWEGFGFSDAEPLLNKVEFLSLVAASIERSGWASRSGAGHRSLATANVALDLYYSVRTARQNIGSKWEAQHHRETLAKVESMVTPEVTERVHKALEWVEFEADTSNEFIGKLHAALAGEGLVAKHAGIAAALFVAYDKANQRAAEQALKEQASDWVGTVGERDEFNVKVVAKRTYEKRTYSYYDSSVGVLVILATDEGASLKWFTTPGKTEGELEEGKRYRVVATVKDHGEWKGTKETTVSRVSVREAL